MFQPQRKETEAPRRAQAVLSQLGGDAGDDVMGKVVVWLSLILTGCSVHREATLYRFTSCRREGDAVVCTCERSHREFNARTGGAVVVCD